MKRSVRIAVSLVLTAAMTILSACSVNINMSQKPDFSEWAQDSAALSSLKSYVTASVDKKSSGYIPEKDRIAVFDMDGTLTCETYFTYFDTCMRDQARIQGGRSACKKLCESVCGNDR